MEWKVGWYLKDNTGEIVGGEMVPNVHGDTPEAAAMAAVKAKPIPTPNTGINSRAYDTGIDGKSFFLMRPVEKTNLIVGGTRVITHDVWLEAGQIKKIGKERRSTY